MVEQRGDGAFQQVLRVDVHVHGTADQAQPVAHHDLGAAVAGDLGAHCASVRLPATHDRVLGHDLAPALKPI